MPRYRHGLGSVYQRGKTWWVSYYIENRRIRESSNSTDKTAARHLLQQRLGQVAEGRFSGPAADRVRLEELAELVLLDYRLNGKRSLAQTEVRLRKHVLPFFINRRAQSISAADIQAYVLDRQ